MISFDGLLIDEELFNSKLTLSFYQLARIIHSLNFVAQSLYMHECASDNCNFGQLIMNANLEFIRENLKLSEEQMTKIYIFLGKNAPILNKCMHDEFSEYFCKHEPISEENINCDPDN